jgi:hypothetical protein
MGTRAQLFLLSSDAFLAAARGDIEVFSAGCEHVANLDKAWHAIHYLVTGDRELRFLVNGVRIPFVSEIFEAHAPESIAALSKHLMASSASALMAKFDADVFNTQSIYNSPWDVSAAPYIKEYLTTFIAVVRQAADQGKGIAVLLGF